MTPTFDQLLRPLLAMAAEKKIKYLGLSLFSVIFFAGCSTTANFYPIEGPLSKMVPLPVLVASVDGISGNTGNISLTLPDGEQLNGKWSSVAPQSSSYSIGSSNLTATNGLTSIWSQVYGSSFSISNLAGVNRGEAILTGPKGTLLQAEFVTGSGTANGKGIAKDNHGNVFRMIF